MFAIADSGAVWINKSETRTQLPFEVVTRRVDSIVFRMFAGLSGSKQTRVAVDPTHGTVPVYLPPE